jgi:hypothetical protein
MKTCRLIGGSLPTHLKRLPVGWAGLEPAPTSFSSEKQFPSSHAGNGMTCIPRRLLVISGINHKRQLLTRRRDERNEIPILEKIETQTNEMAFIACRFYVASSRSLRETAFFG